MNVFRAFTRRSLMEKRSRTLVTIIGIILSMSLFTAVIEGAYSGLQYLVRVEETRTGRYHGHYYGIDADILNTVRETDGFAETTAWQTVGWAEIGSENEDKPYLLVKSIEENFTDLVSVNLSAGRMPENENEILIPEHLASNGNVHLSLGDTLELTVGQRNSDGYIMGEHNPYIPEEPEIISDAIQRTYTVVGFYPRLNYMIEDYSCPGFTALTVGSATGEYGCFFRIDEPSRFYAFMNGTPISEQWRAHTDLLMYSGSMRDSGLVQVLIGFVAVLMFLIFFGSVSLIYNSFSISISDRTKQFGILKSVGATRRQIRFTVLYEAAWLSVIAIPIGLVVGCAGIGITLWCLRDSFSFLAGSDVNVQMKLVISVPGLLLAVLACLGTTLVSAWIPAQKAVRLTAIDAIRQSNDVKIRRRDVRVSWLTKKLFGFEGMLAAKNFGRNRRQYRATVFSLFLSVVLFISASSFCAYLTDTVTGVAAAGGDNGVDIIYSIGQTGIQPDKAMNALQVNGVDDSAYLYKGYAWMRFDRSAMSGEYLSHVDAMREMTVESPELWTSICFLDDENFRELCASNGINSEQYFDPANPAAIAVNTMSETYMLPGTNRYRWTTLNVLDGGTLPATGSYEREIHLDGYWYLGPRDDVPGKTGYWYYPDDTMDGYISSGNLPDDELAVVLSKDEAIQTLSFHISAAITDREFYISDSERFTLIYPVSMMEYVGSPIFREELEPEVLFSAAAHAEVFDRMHQVLMEKGWKTSSLYDMAESYEQDRMLITVINVFSLGFIILISLIAMANVFNTISTGIALRRREFAMLKSVGMTKGSFSRMMNYECMIYGLRSLMFGLPAALAMAYVIYQITGISYDTNFYVPVHSILIAIGSVFAVVFITMLYATHRIRRDNPIDALKNENL